jgi:hypothetical protein
MAIKLQIRRDTLTNWTANQTVVLLSGEIGYVTDTRNMKIGDGTTTWENLKYQAPYYTGANSGAPDTLLALDVGNSRVGVGTSAPSNLLHTHLASAATARIQLSNSTTGSSTDDGLQLRVDSAGAAYVMNGESTDLLLGTSNTERMRIASGGNVGIGTNSPQSKVHIEGTAPIIRLKDTTEANNAYSLIDANNDDGSINISADHEGTGKDPSTVSLSVDGTTRLQATTTGVSISGTTTCSENIYVSTGGVTVNAGGLQVNNGGLNVISGTVSLPTNTVSLGALATIAAGRFIGNNLGSTATPVAVTQAQAQTMLGLPTRSLGSVSVVGTVDSDAQKNANLALGAWAQFQLTSSASDSTTVGIASQTWLYFVFRDGGTGRIAMTIQTNATTLGAIITATGHASGGNFTFCVCRIA